MAGLAGDLQDVPSSAAILQECQRSYPEEVSLGVDQVEAEEGSSASGVQVGEEEAVNA